MEAMEEEKEKKNDEEKNIAGVTKPSYLKNVNCSGEPKNMAALTDNEWTAFFSPWLYLFRLKSEIWTGQNLVS